MEETQVRKAETLVIGDDGRSAKRSRNAMRILTAGIGMAAGMGLPISDLFTEPERYVKKPHDPFRGDGHDDARKAKAEAKRARKAAKLAAQTKGC